jgi:hypothetical protein
VARRTLRFAGQDFDFPTVVEQQDDGAQSESVLADYFPEINLRFAPKTSRGGRLGRQTQPVTPEISLRQAQQAAGGAAGGGAGASTAAAAGNVLTVERPAWLDEVLGSLKPTETETPKTETEVPGSTGPSTVSKRSLLDFTPRMASPQTVDEAITYLYETQLGRTPAQSEIQSWAGREEFADKGLSAQEWDALRGAFRETPEYKSLSEMVPSDTPKDTGRSLQLNYPQTTSTATTAGGGTPAAASTTTTTATPAPAGQTSPTASYSEARSFTPTNASPQTPEEAVKFLYQTQLGRTPTASETAGWTANPVFADKGLTTQEWGQLISGFQASPEYKSLKR